MCFPLTNYYDIPILNELSGRQKYLNYLRRKVHIFHYAFYFCVKEKRRLCELAT